MRTTAANFSQRARISPRSGLAETERNASSRMSATCRARVARRLGSRLQRAAAMMTSTACASTAMEHTVDESVVVDLRHDENDALVPRVNAGRQIPRNEIAERDAQPVEDAAGMPFVSRH